MRSTANEVDGGWAPTRRVNIPRAYTPSSTSNAPDLRPNAYRPAADRYRDVVRSGQGPGALRSGSSSRGRSLDALIDRYSHRGRNLSSESARGTAAGTAAGPSSRRDLYGNGPLDRLDPRRTTQTRSNASQESRGENWRVVGPTDLSNRGALGERTGSGRLSLNEGRTSSTERTAGRRAVEGLDRLLETDRDSAMRLVEGGRAVARANAIAQGITTGAIHGSATARLTRQALDPDLPGISTNPGAYIGGDYPNTGTQKGLGLGLGVGNGWGWSYNYGFGNCFGWGLNSCYWGCWPYFNSFCNPYWGNGFGFGWNNCWYSPWSFGWGGYPYGYNWCPPLFYSTVLYGGAVQNNEPQVVVVESEPQIIVIEQAPQVGVAAAQPIGSAPAGQAPNTGEVLGSMAFLPAVPPTEPDPIQLSIAAERYLGLGDRAFRDERFADAVYYYTRATELEPEVGVLYLVLSDALFSTGDYAYAAYAVRRAIDLDPLLIAGDVDKRSFYAEPAAFDRQLAVLATFLEEHPADEDARLVLAVNQLFAGAPAAAMDTLEDPLAGNTTADPGARRVLEVARELQFGEPAK